MNQKIYCHEITMSLVRNIILKILDLQTLVYEEEKIFLYFDVESMILHVLSYLRKRFI